MNAVGFDDVLVDVFKKKHNPEAVKSLIYTINKRFELFLSDAKNVYNAAEADKARRTSLAIEELLKQYREISI